MKNTEENSEKHPNKLDRNRSILRSRDLLEFNDWIILACKQSCLPGNVVPGDATQLISISVVGPGERALLDVLVRPHGAVNSELLKIHGCDAAHTFNAPPFSDIHKILNSGFARTRVVAWNPEKVQAIIADLCAQEHLSLLQPIYINLQAEYSTFVGESGPNGAYLPQQLPLPFDSSKPGVTALNECARVLEYVHEMAGSSQSSDAATFNKNWSAAFYKPRLGPTQKLKEFLGLSD